MLIPFLIDSAWGFNKYGSGDQVLRIAVVDFAGFEEYHAGRRLVDKIRTRLEPHDSLEVVDLSRYSGIRKKGALTPTESIELARLIGVDVVVTGTVSRYEIDRFAAVLYPPSSNWSRPRSKSVFATCSCGSRVRTAWIRNPL